MVEDVGGSVIWRGGRGEAVGEGEGIERVKGIDGWEGPAFGAEGDDHIGYDAGEGGPLFDATEEWG